MKTTKSYVIVNADEVHALCADPSNGTIFFRWSKISVWDIRAIDVGPISRVVPGAVRFFRAYSIKVGVCTRLLVTKMRSGTCSTT